MAAASDRVSGSELRRSFLKDRRLTGLLITVGVVLLVAATMIGFSGAYFTSTSGSPGNEFAAGGVSFELSATDQVVNGAGMTPGETRSDQQIVTNTGHRATLVLGVLDLDTASPLSDILAVRVEQSDPQQPDPAYDGPLAGLDQVDLGTFDQDEIRTYTITVTWPAAESSPALEGAETSLRFDWQMESVS